MKKYLLKKYIPKVIGIGIVVLLCLMSDMNFNDSMILLFGLLFFIWMFRLFYFSKKNPRKMIMDVELLIRAMLWFWYVLSLKPLRKWLRRIRYAGFTPKPYPFLALYGNVLDTHMMKFKLSPAFYRDKTPAARAALWRLFTRGAIYFNANSGEQPFLCLGPWTNSPSDGLDQDLEKCLYNCLAQCSAQDEKIEPEKVKKIISADIKKKEKIHLDFNNLYHYADLLNTGIQFNAYSRRDVGNVLGMKRFLEGLPNSYTTYNGERPDIQRIWPEYMTYAYLYGIENSTWRHLTQLVQPHKDDCSPLFDVLLNSKPHRQALRQMMDAVSEGTPAVEDAVSAYKGRLSLAWHAEELYDI